MENPSDDSCDGRAWEKKQEGVDPQWGATWDQPYLDSASYNKARVGLPFCSLLEDVEVKVRSWYTCTINYSLCLESR